MRDILFFLMIINFTISSSQSTVNVPNQYESTWRLKQIIRNTLNTQSRDYAIQYNDIIGTPYADENFQRGKIFINDEDLGDFFLRLDSYRDEIQLLRDYDENNKPMYDILLDLDSISVSIEGKTYKKLKYNKDDGKDLFSGYFIEILSNGKYDLLLHQKTILTPARKAASPNEKDRAARFTAYRHYYMLSTGEDFPVLIPKKKKKFLYLIKKESSSNKIENYLKKERIKLNEEEDLIKLFTYINDL